MTIKLPEIFFFGAVLLRIQMNVIWDSDKYTNQELIFLIIVVIYIIEMICIIIMNMDFKLLTISIQ